MRLTKRFLLLMILSLLAAAVAVHAQPGPPPPSGLTATAISPAPAPAAAPATNSVGPKIQFESRLYNFGKVKSGDPVKYSFVFTNIGDELLEIKGVQPQCGCTAANDWTRKVEPGQTGTIAIQFNSANYNGTVMKNVTVTCNDRTQPTVVVQLTGTLWKPIEINPVYPVLNVAPDADSATATVHIINNTEEPMELAKPQSSNKMFGVEVVDANTNKPGKEFLVTVTTVPPLQPNTTQGTITIKTSSTNNPAISFSAIAIVQPAIIVSPPRMMLTQGPLANTQTNSFTIQNNSTNALELSDASANAKGVDVELKEMQKGKMFTAMVGFPQGFQAAAGTEVTIKSSNPHQPMIRVPIDQSPRPAPLQQAPPQPPFPMKPSALPAGAH